MYWKLYLVLFTPFFFIWSLCILDFLSVISYLQLGIQHTVKAHGFHNLCHESSWSFLLPYGPYNEGFLTSQGSIKRRALPQGDENTGPLSHNLMNKIDFYVLSERVCPRDSPQLPLSFHYCGNRTARETKKLVFTHVCMGQIVRIILWTKTSMLYLHWWLICNNNITTDNNIQTDRPSLSVSRLPGLSG